MPVEILRDTFQRADSASVGTPEYTIGPTYIEEEGGPNGTIGIAGNQLVMTIGTSGSPRGRLSVPAGFSNHGVFMNFTEVDTGGGNGTGYSPFLAVRGPASPTYYSDGAHAGVSNSIVLARRYNDNIMYLFQTPNSTGGSNIWNISTNVSFALGEWGLVSVGDWLFVFFNGRLVYKYQTNSLLGQSTVSAGVGAAQTPNMVITVRANRFRVTKGQSSYPNPGMPRMAWDRDGSTSYRYSNTGAVFTLMNDDTTKRTLNDPSIDTSVLLQGGASTNGVGFAVMFPELRDVYGVFVRTPDAASSIFWQYTTAPVGTIPSNSTPWADFPSSVAPPSYTGPSSAGWRTATTSSYASGVTGVKWQAADISDARNMSTFLIFGVPQTSANVHRVAFWHPFLDMRLPGDYLDMDDVIRGQVVYREFRIKNNSSVYSMNNIVLDLESLDYGTALTDEYSIKRASEGTYQPNTTIPSLAPGAISEIISVRRIVGASATFRLDKVRVKSQIGSLS